VFLHFLHDQLLSPTAPSARVASQQHVSGVRSALRWAAFLSRDQLYVPTVDIVQSPLAPSVQTDLKVLADADALWFVGSSAALDDIRLSKRAHFLKTSLSQLWEDRDAYVRLSAFEAQLQARQVNTTGDLKLRWMRDVGRLSSAGSARPNSPLVAQLSRAAVLLHRAPDDGRLVGALAMVPRRLEDHAFLWSVIDDLKIFPYRTAGAPRRAIEVGLAWHWIASHLDEYRTSLLVDLPGLGPMSFGVEQTHANSVLALRSYKDAVHALGLDGAFAAASLDDVVWARSQPRILCLRDTLLAQLYLQMRRSETGVADRGLFRECQRIRDAVEALTPRQALLAAGDVAMAISDPTAAARPSAPRRVTVLVAVALEEELGMIHNAVRSAVGDLEPLEHAGSGRLFYRRKHRSMRGVEFDLIFVLIGKGQERAAAGTALALRDHKPQLVVNVGIAGAMSTDLTLGDVVIGDQIVSYLANSKAVPDGHGGFVWQFGGDSLRSDELLVHRAGQLDLEDPVAMRSYRTELKTLIDEALLDAVGGELRLRVAVGAIACGPTVGAADAFKSWLLENKRDYAALDMESSGAGIATDMGGTMERIRYLALRGISDFADEAKNKLEGDTKGAARRLAVVAPLQVLLILLDVLPPDAFVDGERAVAIYRSASCGPTRGSRDLVGRCGSTRSPGARRPREETRRRCTEPLRTA